MFFLEFLISYSRYCQKLTKMQITDILKKYILEFSALACQLHNITMCELFTNN